MINEALFESKPANYQDLEEILYTYTDGFTKEEGEYPLDTRKEREEAARILNKYYEEVEKNDLDYDRKNEGGTVDYKVKFKTPKLEVTPDKDPENFNQFVDDSFEDSPVFEALLEKDYLENDMDEAIEKHDTLNPDLWDENNELLPDVKEKLQEIVNKFISNLEENDIKLDVEDICIIGSNASYNYNDQSDIDLHIIADPSVYSDEDLALKIYLAYKSLFNNKYDPLIRGHEVEIYVEPHEVQANSKGIYSLNSGWLKEPENMDVPDIDQQVVDDYLAPFIEKFNDVITAGTIEDVDKLIDDIYLERQKSIMKDGEFAIPNLAFKEFRSNGYLQKLRDRKTELENDDMSLNETADNKEINMDKYWRTKSNLDSNEKRQYSRSMPKFKVIPKKKDWLHKPFTVQWGNYKTVDDVKKDYPEDQYDIKLVEDYEDNICTLTLGYGDDEWDNGYNVFCGSLDTLLEYANKFSSFDYRLEDLEKFKNGEIDTLEDVDGMGYIERGLSEEHGPNLDAPENKYLTMGKDELHDAVLKAYVEDDPNFKDMYRHFKYDYLDYDSELKFKKEMRAAKKNKTENLDEGTAFDTMPGYMTPEEIRAKKLADQEKIDAEKAEIRAQKAAERKERAKAERARQRRIDQREKVNSLSYDSLADMAGLEEDNNDLTKDELLAVLRASMSDEEILKLHKQMFEDYEAGIPGGPYENDDDYILDQNPDYDNGLPDPDDIPFKDDYELTESHKDYDLIFDRDTGDRQVEYGINWIQFTTDNYDDAVRWARQLDAAMAGDFGPGHEPSDDPKYYDPENYPGDIQEIGDGKFNFRRRRDILDSIEKVDFVDADDDIPFDESLNEDTVKQGDKWVNKGKEGTHGKFKTKKAADDQRKAMFANGYHESLNNKKESIKMNEEKVVWSTHMTRDNLLSLDESSKMTALINREYDREMLEGADLNRVINEDRYMWQEDLSTFDTDVLPMIEDQTHDGLVIAVDNDGAFFVSAEDLGGEYASMYNDAKLVDRGGDIFWQHDGQEYELFALPDQYSDEDIENPEWVMQNCDHIKNLADLDLEDNQLEEAKSKDPNELKTELDEIIPLADEYGFKYFTSMPFSNYDNDQESFEYQYPEVARHVKSFFKEMGILSPEEINDSDVMDEQWEIGFDQHDWDVLMRACEKMAKGSSVQFEKEYKTGYNSPLDDDEIVANREQNESLNESLDPEEDEPRTLPADADDEDYEDDLDESAATDNGRHIARQGAGWIHNELYRLSDTVDQLNKRKSLHPGEKEAAKAIVDVANDIRKDLIEDLNKENLNEDEETMDDTQVIDLGDGVVLQTEDQETMDMVMDNLEPEKDVEENLNESISKQDIFNDLYDCISNIAYKYEVELGDSIYREDIEAVMKEVLDKFFADSSDFNEGVKELKEDTNDVRNSVSEYLLNELFEFNDNLAMKVADAIPEYNVDWCLDSGDNELINKSNIAEGEFVEATLDILFANASRTESLQEDTLTEPQGETKEYSRTEDWVTEAQTEGELVDEIRSYGCPEDVTITVNDLEGANGWATVTFTGNQELIDSFLEDAGF